MRQVNPLVEGSSPSPVISAIGRDRPSSRTSLLPVRVLTELHRDSSYPMMGKEAWVAGADRREAPGPKPGHLGRRLRLRHQPPGSWQFLNGGVQRGVSFLFDFFLAADDGRFFAGAGWLMTVASRSARRLPASHGQAASSVISAKLS